MKSKQRDRTRRRALLRRERAAAEIDLMDLYGADWRTLECAPDSPRQESTRAHFLPTSEDLPLSLTALYECEWAPQSARSVDAGEFDLLVQQTAHMKGATRSPVGKHAQRFDLEESKVVWLLRAVGGLTSLLVYLLRAVGSFLRLYAPSGN